MNFRPSKKAEMSAAECEEEERAHLESRDSVSDEELIARMNAAPDLGGELLVALSDFVVRRLPSASPCHSGENHDTEV